MSNICLQDSKHLLKAFTLCVLDLQADCGIILCHLSRGGVPGRKADIMESAFFALGIRKCSIHMQ